MLLQRVRFILFFFFNSQVVFHCVNVPQLFISSSTDGHTGRFHILATVNNAAMNTEGHIFFQINVSGLFRCIPRKWITGSIIRQFHKLVRERQVSYDLTHMWNLMNKIN